jgi:hypothetical protein
MSGKKKVAKKKVAKKSKTSGLTLPALKEALVKLLKDRADEADAYYMEHGPRKHDQDGMSGVSYIQMNEDHMTGWLEDQSTDKFNYIEIYEGLSPQEKLEVWRASGFHQGICNYEKEEDVLYHFGLLDKAQKKIVDLREFIQEEMDEIDDALDDMGDAENKEELEGQYKAYETVLKKL